MKKFSRKMEEYLLTGKAICAVLWNRTVKIAMPFLICSGAILLIAGLWGAGVAAVRYGLGPPDPATPPIAAFLGLAFLGAVVGFFIFLFLVYFFLIIVLLYERHTKVDARNEKKNIYTQKRNCRNQT